MTRATAMALALALGLAATAAPRPAPAATLRVPEEFGTLDLGIGAAQDGDTVSVAAGTYAKIPAAFAKAILLRGRGAEASLTILPGLKAARARVENFTFQLPPNPGAQSALVEATDSLTIAGCRFQSPATGFVVNDLGEGSRARLLLQQCEFSGLVQAARVVAAGAADVRVTFEDCVISDCTIGIEVSATGVNCPSSATTAPPVVPEDVRATLTRCRFERVSGTCLNVTNLPGGVLVQQCQLAGSTVNINAALTGLLVRDTRVQGPGGAGRGIVVTSGRLEVVRSVVVGHDVGITVSDFPDCQLSSGLLGGNQDDYNKLGGNLTWNLLTSQKLGVDYNYWNALACAEAENRVSGQGLGIICDEVGRPLTNCATPALPTTWSRIKAAYGPAAAAPAGARPAPPEGRH